MCDKSWKFWVNFQNTIKSLKPKKRQKLNFFNFETTESVTPLICADYWVSRFKNLPISNESDFKKGIICTVANWLVR